jgi:hypothetical protein
LSESIATSGRRTVVTAVISGVFIAVITTLAGPDDTISAACPLTVVQTVVVIVPIAIVAGFMAGNSFLQVQPCHGISTSSLPAIHSACVCIHVIAIIAGFVTILTLTAVGSKDPVATASQ